mgnify:CR=1 FL=1
MRFKRLLALLLAAALALSLLVGCGGRNQSLSQMLLNLLDGQYQNVSVEIDSDLEAKLRQAISQSETDEELRAALEQLLGGGISFQRLGSGQQGDTAWTLIIYPGTDPDAAARSVYLDLDKVFAALPDDGVYSSGFAMAEMENGYAILVKATVDKAGTEDKPDPVILESIAVTTRPTKTTYWVGESFDPAGMVITATYSNNTTKTISDITAADKKGVSWTPEGALATSDTSITITYGGKTTTVSVTVEEPTVDTLDVPAASLAYYAGAVFDPEALGTITATYTNGKTENVLPTDCTFSIDGQGITLPYRFETVGDYTLTVTYKGGKADVNITVNFGTVTHITVSGPNKKEYELNETFSSAGLKVTAYDGYGNSKTVTTGYTFTITDEENKEVNLSNPFTTAGTYTLTVEYNGITSNSITITVADKGYTDDGQGNYTVTSAEGLKAVADIANNGNLGINITLTENINLTDMDWTPIGIDYNHQYTGTFNGGGHTITGLTVTGSNEYAGLFGRIGSGGKVMNVKLEGVQIESDNEMSAVGGVVGYSYGNIENCSVSGSVSSNSTAGGVVGAQLGGSITGCNTSATVKGVTYAGGIAGYTNGGASLTGCYATDSISVENNTTNAAWAGGVVGSNGSSTLTACYATGSVTSSGSGTIYAGGVTGTNDFGTLTACYHANGTISCPGGTTGGVAGRNYKGLMSYGGIITACYWGSNGQIQGIGEDQVGTGGTTMVTDGDWQTAVDAMNTALGGTSCPWRYSSTGTLIKQ